MTRSRDHALALLSTIHGKLSASAGAVRFNSEELDYLRSVCAEGLAGNADPLRIGKGAGGQSRGADGLAVAALVHQRVTQGAALREACEAVGIETNRDGSKSGAVEKNYKMHRASLDAADRFYAARAAGRAPSLDDIEAIVGGK